MKIIKNIVVNVTCSLLLVASTNAKSNTNVPPEIEDKVIGKQAHQLNTSALGSLMLVDETIYINTRYISGQNIKVSVSFDAGVGNVIDKSGINFFLREVTPSWSVVQDINVDDLSVIGKRSGISTVEISLTDIKPTANLAKGNFYFLYASFISSDDTKYNIDGVGNIKIEADPSVVPASLALDNDYKYYKFYPTGGIIDVIAKYNAGTKHTVTKSLGGVRFMLREMTSNWVVVNDFIANDSTTIGSQSGIAKGRISLVGATPTADLPDDNFYLLFAEFESTDGNKYSISGVAPIYVIAGDVNSSDEIVKASLVLDNENKYRQTYSTDGEIDIVANYNVGKAHTITNTFGGVRFMLREMTSNWAVVNDIIVDDKSTIDTHSGQAKGRISLAKVTPTTHLPEGNFYFLFSTLESTDGNKYNIEGITPINIIAGVGYTKEMPSLALDNDYKYYKTYLTSETIDVVAKYNAGIGNTVTNAHGGVRFLLREMTSNWDIINDIVVDDRKAIGTQMGIAKGSILLSGATPTADLPPGNFYLLFSIFESTDGKKHNISGITPIIIKADAQLDKKE